jgi:ribosomal protein L7Ae-like RNA K-turn-binding protein
MPSSKKNRKRKLPGSFLDCPTLSLVKDFPSKNDDDSSPRIVNTNVTSEATKEIFLDRFAKEIVEPFRRPAPSNKEGASYVMVNGTLKVQPQSTPEKKKTETKEGGIWREIIAMGTNQCLRILENAIKDETAPKPSLMVLARDIYPPTMLAHAPVMAQKLGVPVLLLPGKASNEIGQAIGIKQTSILLFLSSKANNDQANAKVNSFVDFVRSGMISKDEK